VNFFSERNDPIYCFELIKKLKIAKEIKPDAKLYYHEYFIKNFEIIYFKYDDEYNSTMWKFDNTKLTTNTGWIGDFCTECEDIEDEDERDNARSEFVSENAAELKDGCPTEELIKEMREGLYEV